jgi:hypothetical protein
VSAGNRESGRKDADAEVAQTAERLRNALADETAKSEQHRQEQTQKAKGLFGRRGGKK